MLHTSNKENMQKVGDSGRQDDTPRLVIPAQRWAIPACATKGEDHPP